MGLKVRSSILLQLSAAGVILLSALTSGCGDAGSSPEPSGLTGPTPTAAESSSDRRDFGDADGGVPSTLAGVVWLHTDVSAWRETGNLRSVNVSGGTITLDYDKADVWPNHSGKNVNANPWVFVNVGGTWYGATFEWFRRGQTSKAVYTVAGDHIKKAPLNGFRPRSGERYGFMVSGLARDNARNVQERTQVVMYTWP